MPIYAYRCQVCGHQFEVRQSFSDDPLTVCEECGGSLRKLLGDVGVVFKGGGFYSTDSGKRSATKTAAPPKPGESGSKESSPSSSAAASSSPSAGTSSGASSTGGSSAGGSSSGGSSSSSGSSTTA